MFLGLICYTLLRVDHYDGTIHLYNIIEGQLRMMKKIIGINLSILLLLSGCSSGGAAIESANSQPSFLAKPTGKYGIGFRDYHYINTNICPDINYVPSINESYFSPGNQGGSGTNFCHEIMVRVYYPTNDLVSVPTTPYYQPYITSFVTSLINTDPNLTSSELAPLQNLKSWTTQDAPIVNSRFPVILFSPGYGVQAQAYENTITNLVSNGYVVVAIDSVFISGSIQLPDGIIVPIFPVSTFPELLNNEYPEQLNDLQFIYQQIESINNNDPIFSHMDTANISGFGHSLGGAAIVNVAYLQPNWFKAVATLDEGYDPTKSTNFNSAVTTLPVTTPILYQYSATGYNLAQSIGLSWQLVTQNSYSMVQTPNLQNSQYSEHNNFSDLTTLQYMPLFSNVANYTGTSVSDYLTVGLGNGYDIQNAINAYLLPLFNTYSKGIYNPLFSEHICNSLVESTMLECGPGVVPN